jgi:hypothetical protein
MDFHPAMSKQFPQELVDEVIDNLNNPRDLRACSLVSSRWLERSRRKLFANVSLNTWNFDQWRRNITSRTERNLGLRPFPHAATSAIYRLVGT